MAYLSMLTPFEGDEKIILGNEECLSVKNTTTFINTKSKTLHVLTILHALHLAVSLSILFVKIIIAL